MGIFSAKQPGRQNQTIILPRLFVSQPVFRLQNFKYSLQVLVCEKCKNHKRDFKNSFLCKSFIEKRALQCKVCCQLWKFGCAAGFRYLSSTQVSCTCRNVFLLA